MFNQESSITFKGLMSLIENNPLNETTKVKYVRHKSNRDFSELFDNVFLNISELEDYQRIQSKSVFSGLDYIISFLGTQGQTALFWGVFKVKSEKYTEDSLYEYELEELPQFSELKFRVVIDWGKALLSWHQHYASDKKVLEILPRGSQDRFPGYEKVNLSWKELNRIIKTESWKTALQNQKAVYLITDINNGKMYVGSASGQYMLLNRWQCYVDNGHGGNIELKKLSKDYIEENFRYSILDIFKSKTDDQIILSRESWWKNTLLTRKFGYNAN